MSEVNAFLPEVVDAAQAADLIRLADLEACWENLRQTPSPPPGPLSRAALQGKQTAHRAFQAQLQVYNQRYTPAHIPERLLNTPARLGRWCRQMRDLCLQVEPGSPSRCPTHLAAKAYRWADKIAARLGQVPVTRQKSPGTLDAIAVLENVGKWCAELEKAAPSV